jgi:hypothetical protein
MVSEISVRGHLVPAESTLWRQRERKRDKERVIKRRHIEREREVARKKNILFKDMPTLTYFLQRGPTS